MQYGCFPGRSPSEVPHNYYRVAYNGHEVLTVESRIGHATKLLKNGTFVDDYGHCGAFNMSDLTAFLNHRCEEQMNALRRFRRPARSEGRYAATRCADGRTKPPPRAES